MAKYYYGGVLAHAGYKYKDKYKNKYGNWVYVYDDGTGKTVERDQAHYLNELSNQRAIHKGEPSFGQPANKSTQASVFTQANNKINLWKAQEKKEYEEKNGFKRDRIMQKFADQKAQEQKNRINAMGDALVADRKAALDASSAKLKSTIAKVYDDAMIYNAKQADLKKKNAQDKLAQLEKERQAHAGEAIGDDRGTAAAQARAKQNAAKATLLKLAKEREAHAGEVIGDSRYAASSAKRNAANTAASRIAAEKANYEMQKSKKKTNKQISGLRSLNPTMKAEKDKAISIAKKYMDQHENNVKNGTGVYGEVERYLEENKLPENILYENILTEQSPEQKSSQNKKKKKR